MQGNFEHSAWKLVNYDNKLNICWALSWLRFMRTLISNIKYFVKIMLNCSPFSEGKLQFCMWTEEFLVWLRSTVLLYWNTVSHLNWKCIRFNLPNMAISDLIRIGYSLKMPTDNGFYIFNWVELMFKHTV